MSDESIDLPALSAELERMLRLRSNPFGMKMFETVEAMEAIPKIRRPKSVHTTDQIVAQAARLGWTVGITADDLEAPDLWQRWYARRHPQDAERNAARLARAMDAFDLADALALLAQHPDMPSPD
jgi:hypothetical protein